MVTVQINNLTQRLLQARQGKQISSRMILVTLIMSIKVWGYGGQEGMGCRKGDGHGRRYA